MSPRGSFVMLFNNWSSPEALVSRYPANAENAISPAPGCSKQMAGQDLGVAILGQLQHASLVHHHRPCRTWNLVVREV